MTLTFGQYQHIQNNIVTGNIGVNTSQLGVAARAARYYLAAYGFNFVLGFSSIRPQCSVTVFF